MIQTSAAHAHGHPQLALEAMQARGGLCACLSPAVPNVGGAERGLANAACPQWTDISWLTRNRGPASHGHHESRPGDKVVHVGALEHGLWTAGVPQVLSTFGGCPPLSWAHAA